MSVTNTPLRRILTVIAVAASLVLGFGAIRAAAAWTADGGTAAARPVGRDAAGPPDRGIGPLGGPRRPASPR